MRVRTLIETKILTYLPPLADFHGPAVEVSVHRVVEAVAATSRW